MIAQNDNRGMFGVHNSFVNPEIRLKPCLVVTIFSESRFRVKTMFSGFHLELRFSVKLCSLKV